VIYVDVVIGETIYLLYADEESAILLTAFKEKNPHDYQSAITRAEHIYAQLEE